MPENVEVVTYISDLNPAEPNGARPKADGDDHIRNVKLGLKQTFPNINAPVNATPAQLNLLVGKTNVATLQDIADATLSASVPGVNDPANADKFFKGGGLWASIDLRGAPAGTKDDSGTTAQVLNYADGEAQTIKATGSHSLTVTGLPEGRFAGILARLQNYGAFSLTTTGITWIKPDGGETTNFADAGVVLRATGYSHVLFFSYGDSIIYGKAA